MTKDPICGMTVDEASALSAERDGQKFYFCSDYCRKKFLSPPAAEQQLVQLVGPSSRTQHSGPSAQYFCPMCPGVESNKPGDCPKCGMALERNPAWVAP